MLASFIMKMPISKLLDSTVLALVLALGPRMFSGFLFELQNITTHFYCYSDFAQSSTMHKDFQPNAATTDAKALAHKMKNHMDYVSYCR